MSLIDIQKKIGSVPDGSFGRDTARAMAGYLKINPTQAAHFLGQCTHETGGWRIFEENLNYSKEALLRVFPKYFTEEEADVYARNPIEIANRVYGGRMGNNTINDGWQFRGRGAIQLTGKYNYQKLADDLDRPEIIAHPNLVATEFALESAIFFFESKGFFNKSIDMSLDCIQRTSVMVNGGYNGLKDREEWTLKIYQWITA